MSCSRRRFQSDLLPRLAEAYADKRRLIFVHIPKCAGADMSNKLKARYPWLDHNVMDHKWTTKHDMLRHLSRLAVKLRFATGSISAAMAGSTTISTTT